VSDVEILQIAESQEKKLLSGNEDQPFRTLIPS
jgi:hypothetical protein